MKLEIKIFLVSKITPVGMVNTIPTGAKNVVYLWWAANGRRSQYQHPFQPRCRRQNACWPPVLHPDWQPGLLTASWIFPLLLKFNGNLGIFCIEPGCAQSILAVPLPLTSQRNNCQWGNSLGIWEFCAWSSCRRPFAVLTTDASFSPCRPSAAQIEPTKHDCFQLEKARIKCWKARKKTPNPKIRSLS